MTIFCRTLQVFLLIGVLRSARAESNWPSWRGPYGNGSTGQGTYALDLDKTNALWIAELPGKGSSTPVVWDKRIILTSPTNGLDAVLAFDWNGKELWSSSLGPESPGAHPNGSGCNASPVTDGAGIFVRFKSGSLAALSFDGKVLWQTNLIEAFGPEKLYWDQATSPVLTRNDVVVARMHGGDSWLAAFNKTDGRMHWKVERNYQTPVEGDHAYTTPLLIEQQEKQCILVWGAEHLTTYDATDGRVLWTCGDFNPHAFPNVPAVASTVIGRNVVVVASGRADRGKPTLYGIKLGGSGDVTTTHRVWKREDTGTFVPTPAEYRGSVYVLRDRGEVECLSPATGKTIWKDGFPRASANFYASPLIAGENLYAAREDGAVFVAKINESFKIISTNYLGEHVIASPVAVSNRLFLRGSRHLFCFAPP